jgi:hypothetical protein
MAVFWVVAMTHRPDDGGSKDLWNVGKLLPDYTALRTHRRENLKSHWVRQDLSSYVDEDIRGCLPDCGVVLTWVGTNVSEEQTAFIFCTCPIRMQAF